MGELSTNSREASRGGERRKEAWTNSLGRRRRRKELSMADQIPHNAAVMAACHLPWLPAQCAMRPNRKGCEGCPIMAAGAIVCVRIYGHHKRGFR